MSETYDKLKAKLDGDKKLTDEDISKMVAEHGEMTEEERIKLEADRLEVEKQQKAGGEAVTLDQYLEALKKLDELDEGSDDYKKYDDLVKKYEQGG